VSIEDENKGFDPPQCIDWSQGQLTQQKGEGRRSRRQAIRAILVIPMTKWERLYYSCSSDEVTEISTAVARRPDHLLTAKSGVNRHILIASMMTAMDKEAGVGYALPIKTRSQRSYPASAIAGRWLRKHLCHADHGRKNNF
jgi:hypothetical protein